MSDTDYSQMLQADLLSYLLKDSNNESVIALKKRFNYANFIQIITLISEYVAAEAREEELNEQQYESTFKRSCARAITLVVELAKLCAVTYLGSNILGSDAIEQVENMIFGESFASFLNKALGFVKSEDKAEAESVNNSLIGLGAQVSEKGFTVVANLVAFKDYMKTVDLKQASADIIEKGIELCKNLADSVLDLDNAVKKFEAGLESLDKLTNGKLSKKLKEYKDVVEQIKSFKSLLKDAVTVAKQFINNMKAAENAMPYVQKAAALFGYGVDKDSSDTSSGVSAEEQQHSNRRPSS